MTPEQLKASILQYAIQGKLVEQRPEEGNAEELYHQIQEEKQKLIKEGKIKKQKPLTEITEDEIPFEIPESWKWVRLGTLMSVISDGTHKTPNYIEKGIPFLSVQNISKGYFDLTQIKYISESEHEKLCERVKPQKDDILICRIGTLGKAIRCTLDFEFSIFVSLGLLRPVNNAITDYIVLCINSPVGFNWIQENKVGGGTHTFKINLSDLPKMFIPLPPLEEQHRIVAKIEELLPYVDRYATAYEKLEKFNVKFPEDMKKSILQYAIQGKLVERRPEEGTAEELYQQIQEEKQKLIKEGKIKKEKPLAEITEDEKPFDIPESWKWVRVGGLFSHNTGKAMNSSAKKTDKEGTVRKFITTSNVYWNTFDFSTVKEMFFSNDELDRCTVTKGDILMCEGGAYFGRTAIWNLDYDICFQNHIHRLRCYRELDLMYFYYVFYFYRNTNMMRSKGTAMPGLSSITLHEMIIPLPPLEEQHRIVAKIEELLPYCDQLIK